MINCCFEIQMTDSFLINEEVSVGIYALKHSKEIISFMINNLIKAVLTYKLFID